MGHSDEAPEIVPDLPSNLHSDVIGECKEYWAKGRPWTKLRVLRKGVDNTDHILAHEDSAWCYTAQGETGECFDEIKAVQYSTAHGQAIFFCEKHALMQAEWDAVHYELGPKKPTPMTKEQEAFVAKLLEKKKPKKERENELQELDP